MNSLDFTGVELKNLITHHVGNKLREEKYMLSDHTTTVENKTKDFLLKYFLLPVRAEYFYAFYHPVKLDLNEICSEVDSIFSDSDEFIKHSQSIAKLLYEKCMHPKIKEGELNIAHFSNVVLDGKVMEAIGIFKSENDVPFLKMKNENSKFNIFHDYGYEIKGMDKGCIIFKIDQEDGYRILIHDHANKSAEAQYWKDDFLKVRPVADEFHKTNEFLAMTKQFVKNQLAEQFEFSRTDQIDLLNRSVEYFKTHDSFKKSDFEEKVLQDSATIKAFQDFDSKYRLENEIELTDIFNISPQAVKKQARLFKSVVKLDKNFHIYIHGNRDLIEQGVDENGRKFYKIYYENET